MSERFAFTRTLVALTLAMLSASAFAHEPPKAENPLLPAPTVKNDSGWVGYLLVHTGETPPPAWLKPGVRITWLEGSGTTAGDDQIVECDQNDSGAWQDEKTQKWYKENPKAMTNGAMSVFECTVLGVGDGKVLVSSRGFLVMPEKNQTKLKYMCPRVGVLNAAAAQDLWASPDLLAKMNQPNVKHGAYKQPANWGGREFANAIYVNAQHSHHTYDSKTGLLIAYSMRSQSDNPLRFENELPREGNTGLELRELLSVREMPYPWIGKPVPEWVGHVKSLTYDVVSQTIGLAGVPAHAGQITFAVKGRVGDCLGLVRVPGPADNQIASGQLPLPGQPVACGSASAPGSFYLPPAGLAGLKVGQELDADPSTKLKTTVSKIDKTAKGRPAISIQEAGEGLQSEFIYDLETGMLLSLRYASGNGVTIQATTIGLRSVEYDDGRKP